MGILNGLFHQEAQYYWARQTVTHTCPRAWDGAFLGLFLGTRGYDSGAFWRLNNVDPSQIEAYEHWI
jgi:hypothetical protein